MNWNPWPLVVALCLAMAPSTAGAGLYHWVDEDGVHYYSDHEPLEDAEILQTFPETPHDEEADAERMERYRQWRRQERREFLERMERIRAEEEARRAEERAAAEAERQRREEERRVREEEAEERRRRRSRDGSVTVNPGRAPLGMNPGSAPEPPDTTP